MATALGYVDPETIDVPRFDVVEVLKLQHDRRRAGLPVQPALRVAVDARIRPQQGVA